MTFDLIYLSAIFQLARDFGGVGFCNVGARKIARQIFSINP
jgi:hypothetical protein